MTEAATTQWLRGAGLADGRVVDACVDSATGLITDVVDTRRENPAPWASPR